MSIESQFDREEEAILQAEACGAITHNEALRELRDLRRDYQAAAEEAAQDAYERELASW